MIKIGLIGYNEGNGHPYSFSAIINGYNDEHMSKCPYPVVYSYLKARPKEELVLEGMKLTHIWTPVLNISRDIALCGNIATVVSEYHEMCDEVDAVIIARDDVDSHFEIAKFFLDKGKFVFVDKPLCRNEKELDYFIPFLYAGRLMTCSGLRYKSEIRSSFYGRLNKEDILFVNATSVLDWYKYAIHVLEGLTPILGYDIKEVVPLHDAHNFMAKILYKDNKSLMIQINKEYPLGIEATIYTKTQKFTIDFNDNFGCFRYMLCEFRRMIMEQAPIVHPEETIAILRAVMKGGEHAYE